MLRIWFGLFVFVSRPPRIWFDLICLNSARIWFDLICIRPFYLYLYVTLVHHGYCKLQEAVCTCKQPKQNNFRAGVRGLARRRTRCRLTGLKSTHHLNHVIDRRSSSRSLHAFSHLLGGLHTYVFRQFRPNLGQGWPRTRFGRRPAVDSHLTGPILPFHQQSFATYEANR